MRGVTWAAAPANVASPRLQCSSAPSNLTISGRYVLSPDSFDILALGERGASGEIQLTDGMKGLAKSQAFHGVRFDGRTYDCGAKLGFPTNEGEIMW